MTKLHELAALGQSVWLDYTHRSLIQSGRLRDYVDKGLRGVTSNPTIFEQAITGSEVYDEQIRQLAHGRSPAEIYEALAVEDARNACDVLRPVFDASQRTDGFFSQEVDPHLAHDTHASVRAARRFFNLVDRPNLMVKIPATPEGMPAIKTLTAEGQNINITLMFSLSQYDQVAQAYLAGLEERFGVFHELKNIVSVASFFVSRVDTKVDKLLDQLDSREARELKGRIGIANARMAYQRFKETFSGPRWEKLLAGGAHVQRVLYGSTGTKNPAYSDVLYVDNLIGPDTINTMPPETIEAFLDHGTVALTLERDLPQSRAQLARLAELGIDLEAVTRQILDEGVEKFVKPHDALMGALAQKQERLIAT
jgi:transaldolase